MDIEPLSVANIKAIIESDGGNGWKHDADIWADRLRKTEANEQATVVVLIDGRAVGYGSLVWQSGYTPFAESDTPEIHDLVTAKRCRRSGVATRIIRQLEGFAKAVRRSMVGIGVGLYADYGAAQSLYATLGYVPDSRGITYKGSPVDPGAEYRVDDHLIL
ncbi:MAG: GNAT family N-acetyltransferase [Pseudomonadota bacterium]